MTSYERIKAIALIVFICVSISITISVHRWSQNGRYFVLKEYLATLDTRTGEIRAYRNIYDYNRLRIHVPKWEDSLPIEPTLKERYGNTLPDSLK